MNERGSRLKKRESRAMNEMRRLLFVHTDVCYDFVCRPPSHLPVQHTSLLRATPERQNQSEEETGARHHVFTEGKQRHTHKVLFIKSTHLSYHAGLFFFFLRTTVHQVGVSVKPT